MDWQTVFEAGLPYGQFLDRHGDPERDAPRWERVYEQMLLTAEQRALLGGFRRLMRVLCLTGAWCGDCVGQCPIFQRFAEAADDKIDLRFIDRDVHVDVADELSICSGKRVPILVFLTEDYYECARVGDRTLTRYRQMAAELGGAACSTGVTADHALAAIAQEWLNEFERVQWMLRTSARLRKLHGD